VTECAAQVTAGAEEVTAAGSRRRHFAHESPHEGHQESTILQALEVADIATNVVWERAGDKTPVERLRLALQAATEQLEMIAAALVEDEKQPA
jgi:hypothetical protein